MNIEELDSKLSDCIAKSRLQVRERVEKYGKSSPTYHDEGIDMCNSVLDAMDAFRAEIVQYLKEAK